ncbi:KN motif and ankyrin repeat domain-containing protein 3-like [Uloborus diversus]|uniref:KN motif and ankyrin repeat domain-containing protein 3-like n=1 Tax=Uloborus diversus TaxID=327109 RepID=UPI00240A487A|nr:KN motif and ankyrin repeat domain-containing protein 3-like [Uloborus diversus]
MLCATSEPESERDWILVAKTLKIGNVNVKSHKTGHTPLMNAVARGLERMVRLLLEEGADPNTQDFSGSTALMYAAEYGREGCAKALLEHHKCDSTLRDKDGKTACQIALTACYKDLALLIHLHEKKKMKTNQIRLSPKSHQKWTRPPTKKRIPQL